MYGRKSRRFKSKGGWGESHVTIVNKVQLERFLRIMNISTMSLVLGNGWRIEVVFLYA